MTSDVENHTSPVTFTEAGPPFDMSTSDLIVRSSDNVDFRFWKATIESVSPVLAEQLNSGSLAYVDVVANGGGSKRVPLLQMPEISTTVGRLLLTLFPPSDFYFNTLDELRPVLAAAHKYQMDTIVDTLAKVLIHDFAQTESLRVYCIAKVYNLTLVQKASAYHWLSVSFHDPAKALGADELRDINGLELCRLLLFRSQCVASLAEAIKDFSWCPDDLWNFISTIIKPCACAFDKTVITLRGPGQEEESRTLKRWFFAHYQRITTVLKDTPTSACLKGDAFCDQAYKDVCACGNCRGAALEHMRKFMELLGDHVDKTVSEVLCSVFGKE